MLFGKEQGSWAEGGAEGQPRPIGGCGKRRPGWRSGDHGLGPRLTSWSRQSRGKVRSSIRHSRGLQTKGGTGTWAGSRRWRRDTTPHPQQALRILKPTPPKAQVPHHFPAPLPVTSFPFQGQSQRS